MTHFDEELNKVRADILDMWGLTVSQLSKAKEALVHSDKSLSKEIKKADKRINALELKIDKDCENLIATHNPVAVDLRFLISILQINNNLERIGDFTKGIAKVIINAATEFDKELIDNTEVLIMIEEAYDMNNDLFQAFQSGDLTLAMSMFQRDKMLDEINLKSKGIIVQYLTEHNDKISQGLEIREIILKLERIGDQCCNIAEEFVFYVEAQVLKHSSKKRIIKSNPDPKV